LAKNRSEKAAGVGDLHRTKSLNVLLHSVKPFEEGNAACWVLVPAIGEVLFRFNGIEDKVATILI
jgi:hypothetical protein